MSATIEVEKILRQIESGAARISDLVKAIKGYTYMDQSGEKEGTAARQCGNIRNLGRLDHDSPPCCQDSSRDEARHKRGLSVPD